ncbi:MAG: GNAT family N-acetyltransferase [Candidatus Pacearchaeota archaeon]|nr:GNAT family N-acetyltransferase [Candidatus Pacearchaeota archaeon]
MAQSKDAETVAELHRTEIATGFLSSLPQRFLVRFYKELITSDSSFCVVAEEQGGVVGFASGSTNPSSFSRSLLLHSFFFAVRVLLPQMLNPLRLKRMFESLLYPQKMKEGPKAELFSIAVGKEFQGKGAAPAMLHEFAKEMKRRGVRRFKLAVGRDLKRAIAFYEKSGFQLLSEVKVHGNAVSLVYVYDIS